MSGWYGPTRCEMCVHSAGNTLRYTCGRQSSICQSLYCASLQSPSASFPQMALTTKHWPAARHSGFSKGQPRSRGLKAWKSERQRRPVQTSKENAGTAWASPLMMYNIMMYILHCIHTPAGACCAGVLELSRVRTARHRQPRGAVEG